MNVKYKYILICLLFCTSFFCSLAQTQSNAKVGSKDLIYVSLYSKSNSKQGSSKNDVVWPEDKISNYASKGLFIEEIAITPTGYNLLYTDNYRKQLVSRKLDYNFIKQGKEKGYALTEICNSPEGLILVMSDIPEANQYGYTSAATMTEVLSKAKAAGSQVFKFAWYNNHFFGLTKSSLKPVDQKINISTDFPSSWINGQIRNGYTLTDFCYNAGVWYVLMTAESLENKTQYVLTTEWDPKKEWDLGNRYSKLVYAYDFVAAEANSKRLYTAGRTDLDSDRKDIALTKFNQAIVAYPYYYYPYYLRGFLSYHEEKYEQSIKDYSILLDRFKRSDKGYFLHRGLSYSKTKNYKLALKDFDEFLKQDSKVEDKITVLVEAVEAQRQLGNPKGAIVYLDQLIKLKPNDEDFKFLRAELLKSPEVKKPTLVWDTPFNATTTVQAERMKISACVYLYGQTLKSYKIILNGKEVPIVGKRGLTIEEVCDQKIEQNITLIKGENILEIVLYTDKHEVRSEKRKIIYNQNQGDKKVEEERKTPYPIDSNKPTIVWDAPFNATTTVQTQRLKIAACVNLKGQKLKSFRILLNNEEVSFVGKRGVTVEETCDLSIDQHVSLQKGDNIVEIIVVTDKSELRSEKRRIIYK